MDLKAMSEEAMETMSIRPPMSISIKYTSCWRQGLCLGEMDKIYENQVYTTYCQGYMAELSRQNPLKLMTQTEKQSHLLRRKNAIRKSMAALMAERIEATSVATEALTPL